MDVLKNYRLTKNFVIQLNSKGKIIDITPKIDKSLGYKYSEFVHNNFINYIFKDDKNIYKSTLTSLKLRVKKDIELRLINKQNNAEWFNCTFLKIKKDNKFEYVIYCNHIHKIKIKEKSDAYRTIAHIAPIPILGFKHPSFSLNYNNNRFLVDLGYGYTEIKEFKKWYSKIILEKDDILNQEDEKLNRTIRIILAQSNLNSEILLRTIKCKNGDLKTFEISFSGIDEENLFAFFHDVTDKVNAQNKLKENQQKISNLLENLPVPILSFDTNNNSFLANKKQRIYINHILPKLNKPEDFAKYILLNSHNPNAKKIFLDSLKEIKSKHHSELIDLQDNEYDLLCADGLIRTFIIKRAIIGSRLVLVFKNITEQRKITTLLEESEKKFKALALNMPTAISAYDINENVVFVNKHFTKLTGFTIEDVPNLSQWYKRSQPDKKIRNEFHNYWKILTADYRNGKLKKVPIIITRSYCKDGSYKYFNFLFSIYKNIFYIQMIDVTEEQTIKKELLNSHKQLRQLTNSLQEEIEKERKHISREIHDELGQQLTGIKMEVSNLQNKTNKSILLQKDNFISVLNNIDYSIKVVRNISTKLRPILLDDLGLNAAVEWYLKEFSSKINIQTSFKFSIAETELTKENQLLFFRIIQEALTNIARHANATKTTISLTNSKSLICLKIIDNGIGFDTKQISANLGLRLMKERVLINNGTLDIFSEKEKGTTIKICITRNNIS